MNILNARELREKFRLQYQDYLSDLHIDLDNYHYAIGFNDTIRLRHHLEDSREYRIITEEEFTTIMPAIDQAIDGFDREHLSTITGALDAIAAFINGFRSDLRGSIAASVSEPQGSNRSMTFSIPRYRRRFLGIYERFHTQLMNEDIQNWKKYHTVRNTGVIVANCGAITARARTHMDYDIITMTEFNAVVLGCGKLTNGIRLAMLGGGAKQKGYIEASNGLKVLGEFLGRYRTTFGGAIAAKVRDAVSAPPALPVSTQISLREMDVEYVKRVVYAYTTRRPINYGASTMKPENDGVYVYDFNSEIAAGFIPSKDIEPYTKRFKNLSAQDLQDG